MQSTCGLYFEASPQPPAFLDAVLSQIGTNALMPGCDSKSWLLVSIWALQGPPGCFQGPPGQLLGPSRRFQGPPGQLLGQIGVLSRGISS